MERLAGRVILLWGWRRWLVACLAGAVASLALAPVDFPAACVAAFPILVWLLDGAEGTGGRAARLLPAFTTGWWFGLGYFAAGMWWIGAGFFGPEAPQVSVTRLALAGLPALLALFYGLAALVARMLWSDGLGRIAALAFAFGMAEWLRAVLLSGFAWNAIGYTAMPIPVLMQGTQLIGIFGISALAVFVFSAPALIVTRRHARAGLAVAGVLTVALVGYGYLELASTPRADRFLQVRIVQAAAGQDGFEEQFQTYLKLSADSGTEDGPVPQLILWPELAIPFVLAERPDLLNALGQIIEEGQVLLVGTMRKEAGGETGRDRLYDAIVSVDGNGGIIGAADRVHLFPLAGRLFHARLPPSAGIGEASPAAEYTQGSGRRLLPVAAGVTALPIIGSEVAIPGIAAREARGVDIIVGPQRNAAYSGTAGPYQHLRQAQLRAVEAGRPLLAAMSNGLSAAIDANGRIMDALATGTQGTIDISLPMATPDFSDTRYIRHRGLIFVVFFGMLALLLSIRERQN